MRGRTCRGTSICSTLADEVLGTVVRLAAEKRRPPMTPTDLINLLAKAGVPAFAERLQTRLADRGQG